MKYLFQLLLVGLSTTIHSQPSIEWQLCLGGTGLESISQIIQTSDDGYILLGSTSSDNGDVTGWHSGYEWIGGGLGPRTQDLWVVKLNQLGDIEWQKCLGGSSNEYAHDIKQTSDGGYVIIGTSFSTDYDLADINSDPSIWVMKLDDNGSLTWHRCYGGTSLDYGASIEILDDGSFVFCGYTFSNDGDVSLHSGGGSDIWVVKIDALGNIEWQKCLGGTMDDVSTKIKKSTDGGFYVLGHTQSNDGDVIGYHQDIFIGMIMSDIWTIKLTGEGNIEWSKCLGGSFDDYPAGGPFTTGAASEIVTRDNGNILITGSTNSMDGDVQGLHGGMDVWLAEINSAGSLVNQRCYGGGYEESASSITQLSNGRLIISGNANIDDGDVYGVHLNSQGIGNPTDAWVFELDSTGEINWQICLGGGERDLSKQLAATSDSGFIMGGETSSGDGDVIGYHGATNYLTAGDIWVVKLSPVTIIAESTDNQELIGIVPNPCNKEFTIAGSEKLNGKNYCINDLFGKTRTKGKLNSNNKAINIESFPTGIYILTTEDGQSIRFVKNQE